jgi:multidrug efflux pump subunit AcrA (membrane-fusion protein)
MSRSAKSKGWLKWAAIGVALLLSVILTIRWISGKGARGAKDGHGFVKRGNLSQRVTIAGKVFPRKNSSIAPPYNGYIKRIYVKIGDKVKEGAPLVSITQSLNSVVEEIYPIRAPFDGVVVSVDKREGEYVENNKPNNQIVRVDDLTELYVQGEIAEIDVQKVKLGQETLIRAAAVGDRNYKGELKELAIAARIKEDWSRSGDRVEYPVRIRVTNPDALLLPGMSVSIDIIADSRKNALILSHEFIEREGDDYIVTLKNGERRKVKLGLQTDEAFEIIEGLKEGEQVEMVDFFKPRT